VLGFALLLVSARTDARYTGKDALELVKLALAKCGKLKARAAAVDAAADRYPNALVARRRARKLEISITALGRGVDAQHSMVTWLVDPKRCRAISVTATPRDGQLRWALRFSSDRRRGPRAAERKRLLQIAGYALLQRSKVSFGAAALLASAHHCGRLKGTRRAVGWALSGPLAPRQRRYRGKPRGSPLAASLRGRAAFAVSFVRAPERAQRHERYEVYLASLGGRSRDQAIAIYDRKRKRHRWVVQTRACTSGKLSWIGRRGDLVVARATPTHPVWRAQRGDSLLLISLSKARAHRLILPGPARFEAKLTKAGIALKVARGANRRPSSQPASQSASQPTSRPQLRATLISWRALREALGR
jgi:hypothetical protein